jgi:hypothetical protein
MFNKWSSPGQQNYRRTHYNIEGSLFIPVNYVIFQPNPEARRYTWTTISTSSLLQNMLSVIVTRQFRRSVPLLGVPLLLWWAYRCIHRQGYNFAYFRILYTIFWHAALCLHSNLTPIWIGVEVSILFTIVFQLSRWIASDWTFYFCYVSALLYLLLPTTK